MIETGEDPGPKRSKKRPRKSNATADGEDVFSDNDSKRSAKRKKTSKLDAESQATLNTGFLQVLESIRGAYDGDRPRSALFEKLPSKKHYKNYYQIIKKPIDLLTISRRVEQNHYSSQIQFKADLDLLFSNALTYNIEGSEVHEDALILQV